MPQQSIVPLVPTEPPPPASPQTPHACDGGVTIVTFGDDFFAVGESLTEIQFSASAHPRHSRYHQTLEAFWLERAAPLLPANQPRVFTHVLICTIAQPMRTSTHRELHDIFS